MSIININICRHGLTNGEVVVIYKHPDDPRVFGQYTFKDERCRYETVFYFVRNGQFEFTSNILSFCTICCTLFDEEKLLNFVRKFLWLLQIPSLSKKILSTLQTNWISISKKRAMKSCTMCILGGSEFFTILNRKPSKMRWTIRLLRKLLHRLFAGELQISPSWANKTWKCELKGKSNFELKLNFIENFRQELHEKWRKLHSIYQQKESIPVSRRSIHIKNVR